MDLSDLNGSPLKQLPTGFCSVQLYFPRELGFKPFLTVISFKMFMYLLVLFGQSWFSLFANKGSQEKHPRHCLVDYSTQSQLDYGFLSFFFFFKLQYF